MADSRSMKHVRAFLFLFLLCLALFFHDLTRTDLWSSHEARAAQNAQTLLDHNNWLLPRLYDDQPEMQKPPAFYWMTAGIATLRDGVVDRWAVRLPAALAGLGTVLLLWSFLTARGRPIAGLIAGSVLALSVHFTSAARTGRIDMPLTFCIAAAIVLMVSRWPIWVRILSAGSILGLALLLKGPIGIVLPSAVIGIWLFIGGFRGTNDDRYGWFVLGGSCTLAMALALPWFFWVNQVTHGEFVRSFFWHHNFERATGESASLATHPWWYYGPRFAIDFLPCTPLLVLATWNLARRASPHDMEKEGTLGLVWVAAMIGFLSLAKFKRADYLLPAYPGAALLIGCVGERWFLAASQRKRLVAICAGAGLITVMLTGWWWFLRYEEPKIEAVRAQQTFAQHIRQHAPAPQTILMFRVESHLLAYHLGRPIHTLVEYGELNERLAAPGTHWFVTRFEFVEECLMHVRTRPIRVAARSEDFAPARPQRPLVLMRTD